jgi:hypothetical protein
LAFAFQEVAAILHQFGTANPREMVDIVAKYMIVVFIVFLPTLAAAMRYLSEKLAIEAEALSYRDAACWFERGTELLLTLEPANRGEKLDPAAQDIIRCLGQLALVENEAWLKSRRQRPLSPAI